jgi:hypothetical protein
VEQLVLEEGHVGWVADAEEEGGRGGADAREGRQVVERVGGERDRGRSPGGAVLRAGKAGRGGAFDRRRRVLAGLGRQEGPVGAVRSGAEGVSVCLVGAWKKASAGEARFLGSAKL